MNFIALNCLALRPDAKRFEDWEFPYSWVLGSKAAVEYALRIGLEEIQEEIGLLMQGIREIL